MDALCDVVLICKAMRKPVTQAMRPFVPCVWTFRDRGGCTGGPGTSTGIRQGWLFFWYSWRRWSDSIVAAPRPRWMRVGVLATQERGRFRVMI